jgi:holo-[acyl-carrier protein] synthase
MSSIIGLGLDATEIPRIAATYRRFGERFVRRVFTSQEAAYCLRRRDPVPHLAGRFAAKEAAMKALGTGRARGVLWHDIEVVRAPGAAPQLRLHGGAQRAFQALGATGMLVTITHSETLALAHVILTRD